MYVPVLYGFSKIGQFRLPGLRVAFMSKKARKRETCPRGPQQWLERHPAPCMCSFCTGFVRVFLASSPAQKPGPRLCGCERFSRGTRRQRVEHVLADLRPSAATKCPHEKTRDPKNVPKTVQKTASLGTSTRICAARYPKSMMPTRKYLAPIGANFDTERCHLSKTSQPPGLVPACGDVKSCSCPWMTLRKSAALCGIGGPKKVRRHKPFKTYRKRSTFGPVLSTHGMQRAMTIIKSVKSCSHLWIELPASLASSFLVSLCGTPPRNQNVRTSRFFGPEMDRKRTRFIFPPNIRLLKEPFQSITGSETIWHPWVSFRSARGFLYGRWLKSCARMAMAFISSGSNCSKRVRSVRSKERRGRSSAGPCWLPL